MCDSNCVYTVNVKNLVKDQKNEWKHASMPIILKLLQNVAKDCSQYSWSKKASTKKLGFPPREVSFELFPCTSCYVLSLKTKPKSRFSQELSRCLGMIC